MDSQPLYPDLTPAALWQDFSRTLAAPLLERVTYPWDLLPLIKDFILTLGPTLPDGEYEQRTPGVWVARSAVIAPTAFLGAPCIIGPETEIRHCAFIRGSALVGRGAVIGNSVELKNCILFDGVQVPHFNYVGDSVLGYKSHMGAGSVTSNVKSDKTNVCIHIGNQSVETGRKKMGAMLGDFVEVGCNSVLNPGTVIGAHSNVYPTSSVRGFVPGNRIYKSHTEIAEKR